MDRTPFDLMALPIVAIRKSLSFMSPSRLLRMSRTSEQSRDLIKSIKFNVQLWADEYTISVGYANGKFSKTLYLGPNKPEWMRTVSEITRLFGTSADKIELFTNNIDDIWNWIKTEQSGVKKLALPDFLAVEPERVMKMILDNSKLTQLEELQIDIWPPPNLTDPFVFKNTPKKLWIGGATWFTVQNLMDSKVEHCGLLGVQFTGEEINFILKQWIDNVDCLSNLTSLTIHRGHIDFDVAFNGFQRENQRLHNRSTHFRLTCGNDFYFKVKVDSMGRLDFYKEPFVANAVADESDDSDEFEEFEDSDDYIDADRFDDSDYSYNA